MGAFFLGLALTEWAVAMDTPTFAPITGKARSHQLAANRRSGLER